MMRKKENFPGGKRFYPIIYNGKIAMIFCERLNFFPGSDKNKIVG
jgi:hypothetical protein